MCARDGHIYYVSLLFLQSQDLQKHLIEAVSMATELSGSFLVIHFIVPVIYYFVLVIPYSKEPAYTYI